MMGRYFFVLALVGGCSSNFTSKTCTTDSDCGDDACELIGSATVAVCVSPADATIQLGQSAPFSGVNAALGTGMNNGIKLAIDEINGSGGIHGRMLAITALDDGYDPTQAQANAMSLTDAIVTSDTTTNCPNTANPVSNGATPPVNVPVSTVALDRGTTGVLALVGSVGTPTAVRATPVATETHTLFYGPFTGATTPLRDMTAGACQKYVFNVRASYAEEGVATMEYFMNNGVQIATAGYKNLISFDQNDSFGQAGYNAMTAAWLAVTGAQAFPSGADPTNPIARFRYTRNDNTSVPAQATAAEAYLQGLVPASGSIDVGIMMTDVYSSGAEFIQLIRQWQFGTGGPGMKLNLHFSNISFVGADALAQALHNAGNAPNGMPFTQDVLVSQVVPNYQTNTAEIVTSYNKLAQSAGEPGNFTALEGYIATKIFVEGLLQVNGPVTPDSMIPALENLPNLSLGLGATAGFSSTNHQYLDSVWGTTLNADGSFADKYYWTVSPSTSPLGTFMSF